MVDSLDVDSQSPSFDFNSFGTEASSTNMFAMGNNGYTNPFMSVEMPMDLGTFAEAFNWVR